MRGLLNDLPAAALLAGVYLVLLGTAEAWRRLGRPDPEWPRKLVHVAGGLVCLSLPFLLRSPWTVLLLALGLTGLFVAGRAGLLLSLHGVGRKSRGAEYYPLAVFLVFVLAAGRSWLYVSAVLVLAVADAGAALVGSRYGALRYQVEGDSKSVEGSLAFLVLAFLAVHLPTLLLSDLPRPVVVLAALLVALLVTGFEAISLGGADNLFVPLAVAVVLGKLATKPLAEIVFQNLSLAAIALAVALAAWRLGSFNAGGAIACVLFAYGTWSLGTWMWALPAFAGLVCYLTVWSRFAPPGWSVGVRVRTVVRALLPPFLVLVWANGTGRYGELLAAYVACCAAVLAIALWSGALRPVGLSAPRRVAAALGVGLVATAVTALPLWLVVARAAPGPLLTVAAVVLAATVAHAELERRRGEAAHLEWTAARFLLSLAVPAAVLALGWLLELSGPR